MPTAEQVVDAIRCYGADHGVEVTPSLLQKFLYYAQAWHLALYDEPFFDGAFEAWAIGPVHRPTIERIPHHLNNAPLPPPTARPALDPEDAEHLDEVMAAYARLDPWRLEWLPHGESPYREVRPDPCAPGTPPEIRPESMRDYYAERLGVGDVDRRAPAASTESATAADSKGGAAA